MMCFLTKAKKAHVPFAYSPNSASKALVNSAENRAKAGCTFCFDRFSGFTAFF